MKTIERTTAKVLLSIVLLIVTVSPYALEAQQTDETETDVILLKIKNRLPKNWNYVRTSSRIHFIRTDSVLVLTENRINAPSESAASVASRVMQYGKPGISKVVYRYETKWTKGEIQEAKNKNSATAKLIEQLPDKHNIKHLYNKSLSSRDKKIFTAGNEEEQKRINNYEKENAVLYSQLIEIPAFHSQNYSLFLDVIEGANDDNHVVFPAEASNEVYRIMVLVREFCDK